MFFSDCYKAHKTKNTAELKKKKSYSLLNGFKAIIIQARIWSKSSHDWHLKPLHASAIYLFLSL